MIEILLVLLALLAVFFPKLLPVVVVAGVFYLATRINGLARRLELPALPRKTISVAPFECPNSTGAISSGSRLTDATCWPSSTSSLIRGRSSSLCSSSAASFVRWQPRALRSIRSLESYVAASRHVVPSRSIDQHQIRIFLATATIVVDPASDAAHLDDAVGLEFTTRSCNAAGVVAKVRKMGCASCS